MSDRCWGCGAQVRSGVCAGPHSPEQYSLRRATRWWKRHIELPVPLARVHPGGWSNASHPLREALREAPDLREERAAAEVVLREVRRKVAEGRRHVVVAR